jgi:acetyl-CoA C-acetyltransferase
MTAEPVFVLGGFQSDFAQQVGDEGIQGLLEVTISNALALTRVEPEEVQTIHVGNLAAELFLGQAHLGAMVASLDPAFRGLPTCRHEAACASGSTAVLAAMADIEAGRYDVALVVGVEVMRNIPSQQAGVLLNCASWVGRELVDEPFPWPLQFAHIADEYDIRWGIDHQHLAAIAETNRTNARRNPNAQTRDWVAPPSFGTDEDLNPVVAGKLRRTDCGRITDGAAVVVLAGPRFTEGWRKRSSHRTSPAEIRGWGHRTAPLDLEDNLRGVSKGGLLFPHVRDAVEDALRRAQLWDIWSVDVAEVHDCFSISEYVAIDHLGLTDPGESWKAVEDGTIASGGQLPLNPSGGLLGLGHPVGATGVRMALDAWKQVTDDAGDYQVEGARTAATVNVGGSFATAVSLIVTSAV